MQVIKRDGRAVTYDRSKIVTAIQKANAEVAPSEQVSVDTIDSIIGYIESKNRARMLVEDIQDIIEQKLMADGKFVLAKTYIIYRYSRELVRKANTTDESILSLIKNSNKDVMEENSNKNATVASTQRDLIAGEVSKDLTKRILLPEKISKAHEEGVLHFHDSDYFLQPIFNCCLINIGDMLDNGTVMNGKLIESPKSFQVACTVMTQIISSVASSQYGGQSVDIRHLGKYLRKSYNKYKTRFMQQFGDRLPADVLEDMVKERVEDELRSGVQTIQYQINTLMTTNGQSPFVTLFLYLDENDEYIEENAQIIEEILRQRIEGIKNEKGVYVTPAFPKLVYVLDECNCLKGGKYDYITEMAIRCSAKRMYPDYISAKMMRQNYEGNVFSPMGCRSFLTPWKDENGNYKFEGRFNQGVVSINLPQIGIIAKKDEEKFWKLLDERLELCYEALMCRHNALVGVTSDVSPIHWQYGAIARLEKGEKIDKLLYNGYSTISLGYIGLYEVTRLMKGVSHTDPVGLEFALRVMNHLRMLQSVGRHRQVSDSVFTEHLPSPYAIGSHGSIRSVSVRSRMLPIRDIIQIPTMLMSVRRLMPSVSSSSRASSRRFLPAVRSLMLRFRICATIWKHCLRLSVISTTIFSMQSSIPSLTTVRSVAGTVRSSLMMMMNGNARSATTRIIPR